MQKRRSSINQQEFQKSSLGQMSINNQQSHRMPLKKSVLTKTQSELTFSDSRTDANPRGILLQEKKQPIVYKKRATFLNTDQLKKQLSSLTNNSPDDAQKQDSRDRNGLNKLQSMESFKDALDVIHVRRPIIFDDIQPKSGTLKTNVQNPPRKSNQVQQQFLSPSPIPFRESTLLSSVDENQYQPDDMNDRVVFPQNKNESSQIRKNQQISPFLFDVKEVVNVQDTLDNFFLQKRKPSHSFNKDSERRLSLQRVIQDQRLKIVRPLDDSEVVTNKKLSEESPKIPITLKNTTFADKNKKTPGRLLRHSKTKSQFTPGGFTKKNVGLAQHKNQNSQQFINVSRLSLNNYGIGGKQNASGPPLNDSQAIQEKSIHEEDHSSYYMESESIQSSYGDDYQVIRQQREEQMKKAQFLDEAMLKRSIKNQMKVVSDQSDKEKQLLLNKFYPHIYQKNAEQLKEVGTKIDRKPPAETKNILHSSTTGNSVFKNKFLDIMDTTRSFAKLVDTRRSISKDQDSVQKNVSVLHKMVSFQNNSPAKSPSKLNNHSVNAQSALKSYDNTFRSSVETRKGKAELEKEYLVQRESTLKLLKAAITTKKNSQKPVIHTKAGKSQTSNTLQAALNPQNPNNQTSIRWDENSIERNNSISLQNLPNGQQSHRQLPIHKLETNASKGCGSTHRRSNATSALGASSNQIKPIAVSIISATPSTQRNRSASINAQRKKLAISKTMNQLKSTIVKEQLYSKEVLEFHNLVTAEIKKGFSNVEPAPLNSYLKSTKSFEKSKLLKKFEEQYRDNTGSLLLAKGIIEHIFQGMKPQTKSVKKADKEVVSIEDLLCYLTDHLLTEDRQKQLETAFTLYLYISRHKIYHVGPMMGQTGSHAHEVSVSQSSTSQAIQPSAKQLKHRNSQKTLNQLHTIRESGVETGKKQYFQRNSTPTSSSVQSVPRIPNFKVSRPNRSPDHQDEQDYSENIQNNNNDAMGGSPSKLAVYGALKPKLQSTGNKQDLRITDNDLFNIIGNPALSFLSEDARILTDLLKKFGLSKEEQEERQKQLADESNRLRSNFNSARTSEDPASSRVGGQTQNSSRRKQNKGQSSVMEQFQQDKQQEREIKRFKDIEKKVCTQYNRSCMNSKSQVILKKSLEQLGKNRTEVEKKVEEETGKKAFKLNEELLASFFTPYKLQLIEQSQRLKYNTKYLKNILNKPGTAKRKIKGHDRAKSRDEIQNSLSQAIQNKAVLKRYRHMQSACTLYTIVNQNPEPFLQQQDDVNSSEDEGADFKNARDVLLKKVSCPLNLKIERKVYLEKSKAFNKEKLVKRQFLKIKQLPTNHQNPWEKTASIAPDGTFKFKQGLERLLLTNKEQKKFIETVRVNTRLKKFRAKAYYDKEGASQKLVTSLSLTDFTTNAFYESNQGIPDIIIVAVYLVYGHNVLTHYLEKILGTDEVCKIEEWPKIMDGDREYFDFCHKQISIEEPNIQIHGGQLIPRTVIRRNLDMPVVMSAFRRNALQSADFFHNFLNQSISYNKIRQIDEEDRAKDESNQYVDLNPLFLAQVMPLFSQMSDPYTSYNEGAYGITLKQLTMQSELLFGLKTPYFGARIFQYLLIEQRRTMISLQGGQNRFKQINTPRDYIEYQTWLDFCYNCCRSDMKKPFDKRKIELELIDRNHMFSIDLKDIQRLDKAVQKYIEEERNKKFHMVQYEPMLSSLFNASDTKRDAISGTKKQDQIINTFNQVRTPPVQEESSSGSDTSSVDLKDLKTKEEAYNNSARYNYMLRTQRPPGSKNLEKLVTVLKQTIKHKQSEIVRVSKLNQKNNITDWLNKSQQDFDLNLQIEKRKTMNQQTGELIKGDNSISAKPNLEQLDYNEEQKPKEVAKIFKQEYIQIVDQQFGKNISPILDTVAWHILSISKDNNPIKYNEDGLI